MLHLLATLALGGGGPQDVLVLVNADDAEAIATAEHYRAARQIPRGQICAIPGVDPTADRVDFAAFDTDIRAPFEACLAGLPDPDEIDYLVVVKGLPYLVDLPAFTASLDAVLQVGRSVDGLGEEIAGRGQSGDPAAASVPNPVYLGGSCSDLAIGNPYASWYTGACAWVAESELPRSFERTRDHDLGGYDFTNELYAVTRLDGFDHVDARALVDRSVASDDSLPSAPILCMEGGDEARAARDPECEYAIRMLDADGVPATWQAPFDPALTGPQVMAFFTGATDVRAAIDGIDWVPGAIGCNLTSFGAVPNNFHCSDDSATCPESESQTSIARMVRAGATGAHGTAAEPLNNSFPNAGVLILYANGYNLAESFLFSQQFLYWQNLVLGDPLASPFAVRPQVSVPVEVPAGEPLQVTASHPDGVSDLALFVDGVRVAEADGDALEWVVPGGEGGVVEILAVARARNAIVQRTGWPVSEQAIRARPQGWDTVQVAITAALPADPTPTSSEEKGGCGCDQGGLVAGWPAWLALLWIRRGRRSRRVGTR